MQQLFYYSFKKYTEWKDGLPDMGWLNELLPDNEQWDKFTTTLINAKDKIGDQLQIGKLIWYQLEVKHTLA